MGRFVVLVLVATALLGKGLLDDIREVVADHSAEALYKNNTVFSIYAKVVFYCCALIWGTRFLLP